jgi:hypothetical protein
MSLLAKVQLDEERPDVPVVARRQSLDAHGLHRHRW